MRYERPTLVTLSQKAFGDVQSQGSCTMGTNPGATTIINECGKGFNANPDGYCLVGYGVPPSI